MDWLKVWSKVLMACALVKCVDYSFLQTWVSCWHSYKIPTANDYVCYVAYGEVGLPGVVPGKNIWKGRSNFTIFTSKWNYFYFYYYRKYRCNLWGRDSRCQFTFQVINSKRGSNIGDWLEFLHRNPWFWAGLVGLGLTYFVFDKYTGMNDASTSAKFLEKKAQEKKSE